MTIRTFIALEIPDEALSEVVKIRDENYREQSRIKWEPVEKLHLTLKFLGDTEEKLVDKISNDISNIISNNSVPNLSFSGFGIFKRNGQAKILWIGIKEDQKLLDLVNSIEDVCSNYGFPKEKRSFKPHITILRIRGHEDLDKLYNLSHVKFEPINFTSSAITFFKSELKPFGSTYTALQKFYLKKE